jgi:hypothetical protein
MESNWEVGIKWDRQYWLPRPPRLYASMNKNGLIVLNAAAFDALKGSASFALLYDRKKRVIGVKYPTKERQYFQANDYGRDGKLKAIFARKALRQFGIEVTETIGFVDPRVEDMGGVPCLMLELDKARPVRRNGSARELRE